MVLRPGKDTLIGNDGDFRHCDFQDWPCRVGESGFEQLYGLIIGIGLFWSQEIVHDKNFYSHISVGSHIIIYKSLDIRWRFALSIWEADVNLKFDELEVIHRELSVLYWNFSISWT